MSKLLVAEHTIARAPAGGRVLDVGSRGYGFSNAMAALGCEVIAVEPDTTELPPSDVRVHLISAALVPESQAGTRQKLVRFGNGTANHLVSIVGETPAQSTVQDTPCYSISEISKLTNTDIWDIVKLDCEGSEYGILLEWPGPIAKQLTVEFHEHTGANTYGPDVYERIVTHLSRWYVVVQHERSIRHCLSVPNYWDSLFVLKDF